jgi:hypothetical protein
VKFSARLGFRVWLQVPDASVEPPNDLFEARAVMHQLLSDALRELRPLGGDSGWLFPQVRDSLSRAAIRDWFTEWRMNQ